MMVLTGWKKAAQDFLLLGLWKRLMPSMSVILKSELTKKKLRREKHYK